MSVVVSNHENYLGVAVNGALNEIITAEIVQAIKSANLDLVVDLTGVEDATASKIIALQNKLMALVSETKAVVLVANDKHLTEDSEDNEVVTVVPSISEATDLLSMIQLEREL